jgi:hypothetical protein
MRSPGTLHWRLHEPRPVTQQIEVPSQYLNVAIRRDAAADATGASSP